MKVYRRTANEWWINLAVIGFGLLLLLGLWKLVEVVMLIGKLLGTI